MDDDLIEIRADISHKEHIPSVLIISTSFSEKKRSDIAIIESALSILGNEELLKFTSKLKSWKLGIQKLKKRKKALEAID